MASLASKASTNGLSNKRNSLEEGKLETDWFVKVRVREGEKKNKEECDRSV